MSTQHIHNLRISLNKRKQRVRATFFYFSFSLYISVIPIVLQFIRHAKATYTLFVYVSFLDKMKNIVWGVFAHVQLRARENAVHGSREIRRMCWVKSPWCIPHEYKRYLIFLSVVFVLHFNNHNAAIGTWDKRFLFVLVFLFVFFFYPCTGDKPCATRSALYV